MLSAERFRNHVCRLDSSSNYRLFIYLSTAKATAQSPTSFWTSRLGNLLGHGVTVIKGLFNPTSDHPTPPETPATTQPVTTTTVRQHPAQEHTGMALVIVWYYYNCSVVCCVEIITVPPHINCRIARQTVNQGTSKAAARSVCSSCILHI